MKLSWIAWPKPLWRKHRDEGFAVLGFPCDQFGHQEPGDAEEIKSFCSLTYDVSFPLFAKIEVNGTSAHPLYRWLKSEQPGVLGTEAIKWNFTKFLIDRDGRVVKRYAPNADAVVHATATTGDWLREAGGHCHNLGLEHPITLAGRGGGAL